MQCSADGYYINYQKKGKKGDLKSSTVTFDASVTDSFLYKLPIQPILD